MKVIIEADSQEEFESKREKLSSLIKGAAREPLTPRQSPVKFQNEILSYWDSKYQKMITSMKAEIEEILAE